MSFGLFIIYFILCSWWLVRMRFVRSSGLSARWIIFLFGLKVASGCFNARVELSLSGLPDVLVFNKGGLLEFELLFSRPAEYMVNLFQSGYADRFGGLFSSTGSYWNDLSSNLVVKFLSVCDILSRGNLYINVLFFNALLFPGMIALYRVFKKQLMNDGPAIMIACFLIPSLLYFSSAIHKDGLVLAAAGLIFYNLQQMAEDKKYTVGKMISVFLLITFILLVRNYVLLCLMPALFSWLLAIWTKWSPRLVFGSIYGLTLILFFTTGKISPKLDFPSKLVERREAFATLPVAKTQIETGKLEPGLKSFFINAPRALYNGLIRPSVGDVKKSPLMIPFLLEIAALLLLLPLVFMLPGKNRTQIFRNPFTWNLIIFSLSVILIIGYTVPVLGAIARYRSVYLPMLFSPLIASVNWNFLLGKFKMKK